MPVGRSAWKLPGLWAKSGSEVASVAPRITSWESSVGLVGGDEDDVERRVGLDRRLRVVLVLRDLLGLFRAERDPWADRP